MTEFKCDTRSFMEEPQYKVRSIPPSVDYLLVLTAATGFGAFISSDTIGDISVGMPVHPRYIIKPESQDCAYRWTVAFNALKHDQLIWCVISRGADYQVYGVTPEGKRRAESILEEWARSHRVRNRFDMGPKNWERCKFDLKLPDGIEHSLDYDEDGYLRYQ
jgi:hypothetical protein